MRTDLISCYKPVHLSTGKIVPCGHCLACRTNKAKVLSFKGNVEVNDRTNYPLFVLLTYDNEHLPFYYIDKVSSFQDYSSYNVCDKDGVYLKNIVLHKTDTNLLNRILNIYGKFPVLYKRDVQNFLKRVRITLQRSNQIEKEVRYFLCGEYGPTNFRPHYHLILLFKSEQSRQFIHRLLKTEHFDKHSRFSSSKLWRYGFCNSKLFERGSSSYVTSYLVSSLSKFKLHGLVSSCFFLHSQNFGEGNFKENACFKSFVSDVFCKRRFDFEHTTRLFNDVEEIQVNSFDLLYYTLLPRCRGFGSIRDNLFISRFEFAFRHGIESASEFADGFLRAIDSGQFSVIISSYIHTFGISSIYITINNTTKITSKRKRIHVIE